METPKSDYESETEYHLKGPQAPWQAFLAFHRGNGYVWRKFEALALLAISEGHRKWSADAILHVVRWESRNERPTGQAWKVNNNYSAGYARAFIKKYPQHKQFFELRKSEMG